MNNSRFRRGNSRRHSQASGRGHGHSRSERTDRHNDRRSSGGSPSQGRFSRGRNPRHGSGGRFNARPKRQHSSFNVSQFINRNPVAAAPAPLYVHTHTFNDFGLDERIVDHVTKGGLSMPSPIQDQIIPHILKGHDVVGLANTGTGKTAAFLLPLIHKTLVQPRTQTLVLTPTRELAIQIESELHKFAKGLSMRSTICVGGANINAQIRSLRQSNNFIIGTPGRIKDLMERRFLRLEQTNAVVLDEADRMFDMGFINDMRFILAATPATRQTLCFSATMPDGIRSLIKDFLKNPIEVSVSRADITSNILQDIVEIKGRDKTDVLVELLSGKEFERVIIFGRTKHGVEKLSGILSKRGIPTESIHGNKSQNQRQRALELFKNGKVRVLVATDVAARGLHIHHVSHVINYDLPATYEDYIHRIGRTGRGEHTGKALTFV